MTRGNEVKTQLCVVILGLLGCAQVHSQVLNYKPLSKDEAEIIRVENEWADAAIKRDEARLERVFADDLIWNEDGVFRNKAGVLHRYMVEVQERVIELRNVRMKIEGEIAVVVSQIHVIKTVSGKTTDSVHESTDVFRKRSGAWQLIVEP